MAKTKWGRYFRKSLAIHLILFLLAGGAAYREFRKGTQAPIRVRLQLSGTGTSGGEPGEIADRQGSRKAQHKARMALPTGPVRESETTTEEAPASARPAIQAAAPEPVANETAGQEPVAPTAVPEGGQSSQVAEAGGSDTGGREAAGPGNSEGGNSDSAGPGGGGDAGGDSAGGEDLSSPAVLTRYSKVYPRAARNAGEEGSVLIGVTVSASGGVVEAWLAQSSGYNRLDQAALKSAYSWRFTPAKNAAGQPIEGSAQVRVTYSLEE